ncbi:MAG: glycoside hydrolase family 5 protein, partial [Chloroflexota bacterium]
MKRCRLPLAIALGAFTALLVMACGSAQRASDLLPETAVTSIVSAITEGNIEGKSDSSRDKPNFLSTRGNKIVDSEGNEVRITGVNWFGMETGTFAPHGLWSRNWEEMLDQIADLGFNTIRLPYSSQLFDPESRTKADSIEFEINPDLKGLTGLEVMDKIIEGAGKRGLKVILDRHRPDVEAQSKLWYTEKYTEERWINDWVMLAKRYKGNDTVIGADLHNEPAGNATWGSGDPKTDWRMAAEKAGNAILEANPDWLIIVEGIEKTNNDKDWYWMGGNLADVAKHPINLKVPNKLVYSPHDYGPEVYMQGWFKEANFPANLPSVWDAHWGFISKQGIAPVLLGEFGGKTFDEKELGGKWIRSLMAYLQDNSMHFTYWCINPNSGDTGGILDEDWATPHKEKIDFLSKFLSPKMRVANPSQIDKSVKPAGYVETAPIEEGAPPIPE